ncbi:MULTISPECIES: DUF5677 domain-containing protein [Noviherbaspirillum]|jgi:hypothetical protein|uniref:Uncharacterized protein n=1 Tax=Noviherbaspirillum galbum TaxID=2709383 RepID=A0A6B3SY94_9BURK|nr:DUF5677 domain-containing protein [Noviherbaspirillum galbum]NEX63612.1 hypothetical protein [Noviherbaspirillum galbum]
MHYRDADDEYFEVFKEYGSSLAEVIGRTDFPKTYRAMFGFCAKANSLKTAMFECVDTKNPYAFKVLFRCFCEHYLKFTYLWACFVKEKSDRVGSDYFSFCGAVEAQDYVAAIAMAERLLGNEVVANTRNAIAEFYPDAAKLSARELKQLSGQFKYRTILRFLADERFAFVAKERPFLAQIVPTYALLSSFVHGGPYTDLEMANFSQPSVIAECESNAEVVMLMSATVFMFTAAAISREYPEFNGIAPKVNSIIKRFVADET